jgi:hypothetical protein
MPPFRPQGPPPDRARAAREIEARLAEPRVPQSIADQIRDTGGARAAARLVGRSDRTLRRWAAGTVRHIPAHAQRALARASVASRNGALIAELGGARRVAELTGRSVRTVQRWASGDIRAPRADARQVLQRADAAVRMRGRGITVDPATGRPITPVFVQMTGQIRVNASTTRGYQYPTRNIGIAIPGETPQGIEISADTMAAIVDHLGRGDTRGAQNALEAYLSENYAAVGRYDPQANIGFFIDRIDSMTFYQQDQDQPPTP